MKTKRCIIIFLAFIGIFIFSISACKKPALKQLEKEVSSPKKVEDVAESEKVLLPPKADYPIDRVISDSQGRQTDVRIIGRESDNIIFVRKSDDKRFIFPISKLSEDDKTFASSLSYKIPPALEKEKPSYISIREKEIERLKEEIQGLKNVKNKPSKLQGRGRKRRIDLLDAKIEELLQEIRSYRP